MSEPIMSREDAYRAALAQSEQKKVAFLSSARAAKARMSPARLKHDARTKATGAMLDGTAYVAAKVQQRPVATTAAAGALLLYFLRRPLGTFLGRMYVRIRNRKPNNSETDDG